MELLERLNQIEQLAKVLRPDLHFPSTATLEQRLRWLEIVFEEMKARDNHGVYAETSLEEKLEKILGNTVYVKPDRITLHSLTADPASVVAGDLWFRSDFGKTKQAIDAVVANAKLLRREGDIIPGAEIGNLDASKITSGRFGMGRMPDGASGQVLTAQGIGADPTYANVGAIPSGLIAMWHGILANIPSGWVLCDGNNGTPNLLAKFVEGIADAGTNPGATGGSLNQEVDYLTEGFPLTNRVGSGLGGISDGFSVATGAGQWKTSAYSGLAVDSSDYYVSRLKTRDGRPPYYDVAFVMKT